jgi:hypothetical protein
MRRRKKNERHCQINSRPIKRKDESLIFRERHKRSCFGDAMRQTVQNVSSSACVQPKPESPHPFGDVVCSDG